MARQIDIISVVRKKFLPDSKYKPYNFSSTKCYVITLTINRSGVTKIEEKLPPDIKQVKGIFITARIKTKAEKIGQITLSFNEGIINPYQYAVLNTDYLGDTSHPLPLDETIKSNSLMQGYYKCDAIEFELPFTIKIYLHYAK